MPSVMNAPFQAWWPCAALLGLLAHLCSAGYAPVKDSEVLALLGNMSLRERYFQTCRYICPEKDLFWGWCNPIDLLWGADSSFELLTNERLGIRGMRTRDGPKGMTCRIGDAFSFGAPCPKNGTSPAFPAQSLRAATWDVQLEEEFGAAVGEIAKKLDIQGALLPTINILPWLNWGRAQESYGEDPLYNGKMGAACVRGVQSKGVMATVKHFLANNVENTRWWVSAEFDDKTLHEIYLKAWAIIVAESSPELVMTGYNRVQGKYAQATPKFIKILRERIGFEGVVMSDWFATTEYMMARVSNHSPYHGETGFLGPPSVLYEAGLDMEMPSCNQHALAVRYLAKCDVDDQEACRTENWLDQAVARVLRTKIRYGMVGTKKPEKYRAEFPELAKYRALSLKIAQQGMVLLRNDGDFLPRKPASVAKIVVMGSPEILESGDRGSSAVRPLNGSVTVLDGLIAKYGAAKVSHLENEAVHTATGAAEIQAADMVVLDVGLTALEEGEWIPPYFGGDRKYLHLLPGDQDLIALAAALNPKIVVAITSGSVIMVEDFVDAVKGIVWLGYPGPEGGEALADILAGDVNPAGRMTSATPKNERDWVPEGITLAPWETVEVQYPYGHGFKHMWEAGIQPRYPLGWGLSYTTFAFGAPSLEARGGDAHMLTVSVDVTNTGDRDGIETVQVYATCKTCKQKRLPVHLLGFTRLPLAAGATATAKVDLSMKEMAIYRLPEEDWLLEKASYELLVGPCMDRARLRGVAHEVKADQVFDYPGPSTPIDIAGVGERSCEAYKCEREYSFLVDEGVAGVTSSLMHLSFHIAFWGTVFYSCRFCYRQCRKRCSKGAKDKKA